MEDDMDPELRRVLEESMRTYQQEMGQTGAEAKQDAGEGAEESNASELRETYGNMEVEDDYDTEVAIVRWLERSCAQRFWSR